MFNKYDIALIITVVAIAGVMAFGLGESLGSPGNQLSISIDSKEYAVYNSKENQKIVIDLEDNYNVIELKDGKAKMLEANCPDGYCLRQGPITQGNETIVCLPNKMIVEFKEKQSSVDTVVG